MWFTGFTGLVLLLTLLPDLAVAGSADAYGKKIEQTIQAKAVYPKSARGASNTYEFSLIIGRDGYVMEFRLNQRGATAIGLANNVWTLLETVVLPPVPPILAAPVAMKGTVAYRGGDSSVRVQVSSAREYSAGEQKDYVRNHPATCVSYEKKKPGNKGVLTSVLRRYCECQARRTAATVEKDSSKTCRDEIFKQANP